MFRCDKSLSHKLFHFCTTKCSCWKIGLFNSLRSKIFSDDIEQIIWKNRGIEDISQLELIVQLVLMFLIFLQLSRCCTVLLVLRHAVPCIGVHRDLVSLIVWCSKYKTHSMSKALQSSFKLLINIKRQQSTINDDHHLNRAEGVCVISEIPPVLSPIPLTYSVAWSSSAWDKW